MVFNLNHLHFVSSLPSVKYNYICIVSRYSNSLADLLLMAYLIIESCMNEKRSKFSDDLPTNEWIRCKNISYKAGGTNNSDHDCIFIKPHFFYFEHKFKKIFFAVNSIVTSICTYIFQLLVYVNIQYLYKLCSNFLF